MVKVYIKCYLWEVKGSFKKVSRVFTWDKDAFITLGIQEKHIGIDKFRVIEYALLIYLFY